MVVVRDGSSATSPIMVYQLDQTPITIANSTNFSTLGNNPGIDATGNVVAFYGDLTAAGATNLTAANEASIAATGLDVDVDPLNPGPGIFVSIPLGEEGSKFAADRVVLRIAGASGNGYLDPGETEEGGVDVGPFSAFPDARVAPASMNLTFDSDGLLDFGNSSISVAYLANDTSGSANVGLYTSLVEIGDPTADNDPIVVDDPEQVIDSGQSIPGVGVVTNVSVYFPQNAKGQLDFVASTDSGEAIVEANRMSYTPDQISQAYGIDEIPTFVGPAGKTATPDGAGQTIAIVDAYNDPNIIDDLGTFDTDYGLLAPPSFQIYNQSGTNITDLIKTSDPSVPPVDPDKNAKWELEEAIDVEWAHAICAGTNIILVEANSNDNPDLGPAVSWAENDPGVSVVSLSYGVPEYSSETNADMTVYNPPAGVTLLASTGDDGAPGGYPAYSPNVVAVGGTSLYLSSDGSYLTETAWEGSGGGISQYEVPASPVGTEPPPYQSGLGYSARTTPDVSFVADPATGVQVINSYGKDPERSDDLGGERRRRHQPVRPVLGRPDRDRRSGPGAGGEGPPHRPDRDPSCPLPIAGRRFQRHHHGEQRPIQSPAPATISSPGAGARSPTCSSPTSWPTIRVRPGRARGRTTSGAILTTGKETWPPPPGMPWSSRPAPCS